jgi:translation elongation factor EF-1beta
MLSNHLNIAKKLEEKVSNPLKSKNLEIQPTKKNPILFGVTNFNFFVTKDPLKNGVQ